MKMQSVHQSKSEEKTALVLGGGGSRGAYEIGVWQALLEMGQPIDMAAGASVGSLNAAVAAQEAAVRKSAEMKESSERGEQPPDLFRMAVSLWEQMDTKTAFSLADLDVGEFLEKGGGSFDGLKKLLEQSLDETVIRRSPIDLGLVTVEAFTMQPKYLWISEIPARQLIDYILASCACFPAVERYEIDGKKYIDGGYADNLPVKMALDHGANHIIAVNLDTVGILRKEPLQLAKDNGQLTFIQPYWDLGSFMEFQQDNTRRIMRLGYLDTLKAFGAYDGFYYCFFKGALDRRMLHSAEAAARIFELPPTRLYETHRFHTDLSQAVQAYGKAQSQEIHTALSQLSEDFIDAALSLLHQLNGKTFVLAAAAVIKKEGRQKDLLLSRPICALFPDEIRAAVWLARQGLV